MKFIKDFKDNENIIGHYFCKQKVSGKSKSGKTYLSLKLSDKTGTIDAKIWELNNNIQSFEEGGYIKIDADVSVYQNELQLRINKLRRSLEGEFDPRDYVPCSEKDINSMFAELAGIIKTVSNPHIRQLLESILVNDSEIKERFMTHSAAKNMHHSYLGGLLEHTLSVVKHCEFICLQYSYINRDILVCGAMLHDVGKIYELSELPENDYTDSGQLIGHIVMGSELISEHAELIPGFPEQLKLILRHMILSHHGEYEYGSPKLPMVIEAVALNAADNLDAKIKAFESAISEDGLQGNWLGFNRIFQRNIRKSDFQ